MIVTNHSSVIWDSLSGSEQRAKNKDRRALGLQARAITSTWEWDPVELPQRTEEDEHVLVGSGD